MTTPPVRTAEQRTEDLAAGVRMRQARAVIKGNLKHGRITLESVIGIGAFGAGDPIVGRIPVGQLVSSIPGFGPVKSKALLAALGVNPKKHIDDVPRKVLDNILNAAG